MPRVLAHVVTVGQTRIEVAHAVVIRHEIDAFVHPQRDRHVAGQVKQAPPFALTGGVNPQMAGAAAAIAFPERQVGRVAPNYQAALRAIADADRRSDRQPLRLAALRRHRVEERRAPKGLPAIAGEDDRRAVGRPANDVGRGAQVSQPFGRAAAGRHHVDLGEAFVTAGVGQPGPVRRQRRRGDLARAGTETARRAPAHRGGPQVILAHENDGLSMDRGKTIVSGVEHVAPFT